MKKRTELAFTREELIKLGMCSEGVHQILFALNKNYSQKLKASEMLKVALSHRVPYEGLHLLHAMVCEIYNWAYKIKNNKFPNYQKKFRIMRDLADTFSYYGLDKKDRILAQNDGGSYYEYFYSMYNKRCIKAQDEIASKAVRRAIKNIDLTYK